MLPYSFILDCPPTPTPDLMRSWGRKCLKMLRPGEEILVKLPQESVSERWDPTEWCRLSPLFSWPQYSCTILGVVYVWEYENTTGVEIQWGWLMKSRHRALITRTLKKTSFTSLKFLNKSYALANSGLSSRETAAPGLALTLQLTLVFL